MRTIKVKFEWTILIKVSDTRSMFKKVSTEVEDFTFEAVRQIHTRNYKGIGKVQSDYAYLKDEWGHYAHKMDMDSLSVKVEGSDTVYTVALDYPWLRFTPIVKTEGELVAFGDEVRACGSLD